MTQSHNSYMEAELMVPPLDELCKAHEEEVDVDEEEEDEEGSYHAHLERLIQNLLKEAKDKSKGWVSRSTTDHTELSFKKVCVATESLEWMDIGRVWKKLDAEQGPQSYRHRSCQ